MTNHTTHPWTPRLPFSVRLPGTPSLFPQSPSTISRASWSCQTTISPNPATRSHCRTVRWWWSRRTPFGCAATIGTTAAWSTTSSWRCTKPGAPNSRWGERLSMILFGYSTLHFFYNESRLGTVCLVVRV